MTTRTSGCLGRNRQLLRPYLQALEGRIAPATFLVDDLSDDFADISDPKPGTLRYAVDQSNKSPNSGTPDEITIIKMGMIPMSAPIDIGESVIIDPFGASEIMIDFSKMAQPGPGFNVCMGQSSDVLPVTFTGLTITGSKYGPAILSMGRDLIINASEITGNTNFGPGPGGGGVYFASASMNKLIIQNSTIAGNSSFSDGGGVFLNGQVDVTIINSTISGNTAGGNGGGIAAAAWTGMNLFVLSNSTVTANTANGMLGGGLFFPAGGAIIAVNSSIVSGNTNGAVPDISASVVELKYSAVGSPNGFMLSPASIGFLPFGSDVALGLLGDNGGETRTHALGTSSAAINTGVNQASLDFDQRGAGFARTIGAKTDIGAYELSNIPYAKSKRMDVSTAGGTTFNVVVKYTDDVGINFGTIDVNDVKVTGPNGFSAFATSVVVDIPGSKGTYTFDAPGLVWDPSDIGTYTATMQLNQVTDNDLPVPNAVPATALGDFFVKIPVPIVVNELGDAIIANGTTSIREAIAIANATNAGNATTITFDSNLFVSPTTIQLLAANGGELKITAPVTIFGPDARLTLSGNMTSRVFHVDIPLIIGSVFISDLTLTNGMIAAGDGGAVFIQDDSVTFNTCTISNNTATQNGGGIGTGIGGSVRLIYSTVSDNIAITGSGAGVNLNGSGSLQVDSSTISGNTCLNNDGGGVHVFGSNNVTSSIVNSTISGNAGRRGGGVFLSDWLGRLKIYNSTITKNTATVIPDGGGILIDGVGASVGILTLSSTILAGNTAANGPDLQFLAPLGIQNVPGDNNLVGAADPTNFMLTGMGNFAGTLAIPLPSGLNPLAFNGGPTQTHSLQPISPPLGTGNNVLCLQYDQRGLELNPGQPMSIGSFGTNIVAPPTVTSVKVNNGGVQRSNVFSIVITFSETVNFSGNIVNAFSLARMNAPLANTEQPGLNGLVNISATPASGSTNAVTLTFLTSGANPINGVGNLGGASFAGSSLPDGTFDLTINASKVGGGGGALDGNANGSGGDNFLQVGSSVATNDPYGLFRLFGDLTGDGTVANSDFIQILSLFAAGPNAALDYNNDGDVSGFDFNQFRKRFGGMLP